MNISMKWVDDVRGTDSVREVARRVGMNQGTLNRQINLDQLAFETVREIARQYGQPVIPSLVATGHLSREDAGIDSALTAIQSASDEQLISEIGRRLGLSNASSLYDLPISDAVAGSNVVTGQFGVRGSSEDLEEVAGETEIRHEEDTDDYTP